MKNKYNYEPEVCQCCGQAKTYILPIDWGTSVIVKAVARAISRKGINCIHPKKEMEVSAKNWTYERAITEGVLTSVHIGNFTRARVHGLIARYKNEPGNWLLTRKGAAFLRGERIPRLAVIEKSKSGERSHKEEYFGAPYHTCTVHEVIKSKGHPTWEGIDFDIVDGRIVKDIHVDKNDPNQGFWPISKELGPNGNKGPEGIRVL